MRGPFQAELKFLATSSGLNAMSCAVRTKVPGGISQFECEAFIGQNHSSGRRSPIQMRGVFQSGPKFLAACSSFSEGRFSVGNKIPGGLYQSECEALSSQNQNA